MIEGQRFRGGVPDGEIWAAPEASAGNADPEGGQTTARCRSNFRRYTEIWCLARK